MKMRTKNKFSPRTYEDTQSFVRWYKKLYGDTSATTGTGKLPTIEKREEKIHMRMRRRKIRFLLGNWANRLYVHNGGRRDTRLGKCYSELYLCYFPEVLDDNNTDYAQHNDATRQEDLGDIG